LSKLGKIKSISFEVWPDEGRFDIYELPIAGALRGLAKKHGLETERRPPAMWHNIPYSDKPHLFMWNIGEHFDWSLWSEYKKRNPNSFILCQSGDLIYFQNPEGKNWSGIDHVLESTQLAVDQINSFGVPCTFFHWSISLEQIDYLKSRGGEIPPKSRDAVGLYRQMFYRDKLFNYIRRHGFKADYNLNLWREECYELLRASWCSVDTSSAVICDGGRQSGKGYRQCLGCWLDCPTIIDNFPDYWRMTGFFPQYEYDNFGGLIELLHEARSDSRKNWMAAQREFCYQYSTNKQIEDILIKYDLV
jgi:hypothetical protein